MALLDDVWGPGFVIKISARDGQTSTLVCPECGAGGCEKVTFTRYKCPACLYYLTEEDQCVRELLEKQRQVAAEEAEQQRRRSAKHVPQLPCPDCGGTLWVLFRDGGSHRCFECKHWIGAGDPRLDEAYGRGGGLFRN